MSPLPKGALPVVLAGKEVWLLPQRALFIPSASVLCVADVHVGKAAALQAHAMAVPEGASQTDLHRLTALVTETAAERLVIAGDFVHAPESINPAIQDALHAWTATLGKTRVDVILGNHDRGAPLARALPDAHLHAAPLYIGPFALQHYPGARDDAYVIAGHLHPGLRLTLQGRDRLRLPCFWVQSGHLTLPAFGTFTGLADVPPAVGRHALVASDRVLWAPASF